MDPTKQNAAQVPPAANQPVGAPIQQPVAQPISGGKKEAPIPVARPAEWVAPSTPEVVMPQEVKAAGVESKPVIEVVSEDAKQAGVRMAHSAMSVPTVTEETLSIDTPRGILSQLKKAHKKVSDSFSWLVRLIIKEQDKKERGTIA